MKRWTKTKQCKALVDFLLDISLLLSGVGIFAIGQKTPQPVMAAVSQPPATVILDPGHGGMTAAHRQTASAKNRSILPSRSI